MHRPGMGGGVPTGIRTPVIAVKGRCPRPLDDGDPDDGVNRQFTTRLASLLLVGKLGQGDAEQQSDETQWYQRDPDFGVLTAIQHFPKPNNQSDDTQYQPQQCGDDAKPVHRTSC